MFKFHRSQVFCCHCGYTYAQARGFKGTPTEKDRRRGPRCPKCGYRFRDLKWRERVGCYAHRFMRWFRS